MKYIHFTNEEDAENIIESEELWSSSIVNNTVYAVPVGGTFSPNTQLTSIGRKGKDRDYAVVFTTDELPDGCYPEECYWNTNSLDIKIEDLLTTQEAKKLLNGSLEEFEDAKPWSGSTLKIPTKQNPSIKEIIKQEISKILNSTHENQH